MEHAQTFAHSPIDAGQRRLGAALGYWLPTILLAVAAVAGGFVDAVRSPAALEGFHHLGYPDYFATLLGVAKMLGGFALIAPVPRTLREWAYAGLVFDTFSAVISLAAVGEPIAQLAAPAIFAALTLLSHRAWRSRLQ